MNVSICFRSIIFQPPCHQRLAEPIQTRTLLQIYRINGEIISCFKALDFKAFLAQQKLTDAYFVTVLITYCSTVNLLCILGFFLIKRWGNIVFCPNFCFIIFTWLSKLQKTILKYFFDRHVEFTVGHLLCKELLEESLFLSFCYTHISRHSSKLFLCW